MCFTKHLGTTTGILYCFKGVKGEFLKAIKFFQVSCHFSMIFIKFFKIPWYFQVFQVYSHFSRFSRLSGNPDELLVIPNLKLHWKWKEIFLKFLGLNIHKYLFAKLYNSTLKQWKEDEKEISHRFLQLGEG